MIFTRFMLFQLCFIFSLISTFSWAATVSVHDPSIVVVYKDASGNSYPTNDAGGTRTKYYYVFGTQVAAAYSTDMIDWTAFTPSFSVNGTVSTDYYQIFKAAATWSGHTNSSDTKGNLWAPDILYNKVLNKWCMYFAVNGNDWMSSIVMLTSDKIEGPFQYVGTVVYSGMDDLSSGAGNDDYKKVTGSSTIASRYLDNTGAWTGTYGSSCIDPHPFYDQSGKLWMSYGSWSGGIFLLKLDENTGLRDYTYNYGYTNFSSDGAVWNGTALRFDPYMGIHIGGGYYVSGEGSYIDYFTDPDGNGYYYLFVSMGFYSPTGGYTMRVFRSKTVDGPYTDPVGNPSVFSQYVFNYGNNTKYGFPIMQNYKWNWWTKGDVSMGGNSLLRDDDGSMYVIYHTKYNDGTVFHNVKVHQLFFNQTGWPLAAPFEYRVKWGMDQQTYTAEDIAGLYGVIAHEPTDYANLKCNLEQQVYINADGTLSGAYSGTWAYNDSNGRQYLTLSTSAGTFECVLLDQLTEDVSSQTLSFTGMDASNKLALWGYRYTNTAVTTTTNYNNQPVTVGKTDYSLLWTDTASFYKVNTNTTGDFEVEFTFDNYTLAANNWDNWAVAVAGSGGMWYLRADAWSNKTFSGSTVNYQYNWNWATFNQVFTNKEVRVKVSKIGTTINVFAAVDSQLVYTASATGCPSGNFDVYLGGETCYLTVNKVSVSQLETRQLTGTINADGTYPIAFNVAQSQQTTVSGDFELIYTFNNYHNPVSTKVWDNYIVKATGGTTSMLRADAYALNASGQFRYTYDWNWNNFIDILSGAHIVMTITRQGSVITYDAVITARDSGVYHYKAINTGAPTGPLSIGFTCEQSMVDLIRVETVTNLGTGVVTGVPNAVSNPAGLKVYGYGGILYVESKWEGDAVIYSVDGRAISNIHFEKGTSKYYGLPTGLYIVKGNKVVIY